MSTGEPLLLAIDLGTGSCRAALFDTAGRQVAIGQREYLHHPEPGVPGSQCFDTTAAWALVVSCIREALGTARCHGIDSDDGRRAPVAGRIAAVATTSMREGMVLYDRSGVELWACPNVDSRASEQAVELIGSGAAQRIFELAGDWVAITSPARFRWIAEHRPDVLAATAHVGMIGDWAATKLCGSFSTDPSLGSSSGMFDLARREWSAEIIALCGLDPAIFPEVSESGTVVGEVLPAVAEETGLRAGTPVVVGGADTQMALTGIGVCEPGRLSIVGGTFWQTTLLSDTPMIDSEVRLRTLCHSTPQRWMVEGIGFYCGMAMRWFRDAFCELEVAEAAATGSDPYLLLEAKAAGLPPASGGLIG
ncbi:MAG TPA: FGGY family carbohydrate kinase, partial [Acidimicrobiales bacterium]|nr:FGGY family carbohydrate kinase [Acidimicrobiales bacterium]